MIKSISRSATLVTIFIIVFSFFNGIPTGFAIQKTKISISDSAQFALSALETIQVPVNGSLVTSQSVLEQGVTYTLRAFGLFHIGGRFADAEYAFSSTLGNVLDKCPSPELDIGIGIDEQEGITNKSTRWGELLVSHVYTTTFIGKGAPITFKYFDCGYSDNYGSLTLEILQPSSDILQETISVPANGSSVISTTTLEANITYKLKAYGSFIIGSENSLGAFADAEYVYNINQITNNRCIPPNDVDLGIGIDDPRIDNFKPYSWGAYSPLVTL